MKKRKECKRKRENEKKINDFFAGFQESQKKKGGKDNERRMS